MSTAGVGAPLRCPTCDQFVPDDVTACPADGTPVRDDELRPLGETGNETTAVRDPLLSQTLGEYKVEARIGVGGMGIVYRGVQPVIGKPVAIKVLRPELSESPSSVARLLDEARATSAIRHGGIIEIFSFGQTPDGRQYFVMELLVGESLEEWFVARGKLSALEVVELLLEVLEPLAAAHRAGVVHRDLKPNNIYRVARDGAAPEIKLLDFGLAKSGGALKEPATRNTLAGEVVGTPLYMAPEQARGDAVGPWTDLYALGVMTYQFLTGRLPFDKPSALEVLMAHLTEPVPPLGVGVPGPLLKLTLELLEKMPADRPQSAEAVRERLLDMLPTLQHGEETVFAPQGDAAWRNASRHGVGADDGDPDHTEIELALVRRPARYRYAWLGALGLAALVGGTVFAFVRPGSQRSQIPDVPTPPVPVPAVVAQVARPDSLEPTVPEPSLNEPVAALVPDAPGRSSHVAASIRKATVAKKPAVKPARPAPSRAELTRRLKVLADQMHAASASRGMLMHLERAQTQLARAQTSSELGEVAEILDGLQRQLRR